ncbi:MAG: uroporphyrinogen-III synthase [Actinomycetota bacterium]
MEGIVVGVPAARRAAETAKLIERWGGRALVGPTVEEIPVSDERPVVEQTRRLIDGEPAWAVHLTGVGTKRWLEVAERAALLTELLRTLAAARLIPRGAKANAVLKANGLAPEWIPMSETSAEIAEWLSPRLSPGQMVGLQRHGEPVPGLSAPLREAGAEVVEIASYYWSIPQERGPAETLVRGLIDGTCSALAITSAPQVRNLFLVAGDAREALHEALGTRVFLAAVGTVAAGALEEQGLRADLIAQPARLGALVRGLAQARERVLAKSAH